MLLDVNILLAAHRTEHPIHDVCLAAVDGTCSEGFASCAHTWNGFLRLATHPSVCQPPTPMAIALEAVAAWRRRSEARTLPDTAESWTIFDRLCRRQRAAGNAVYDLHLAALAMAHGCLLVSDDHGFDRIPGLRWKPPEALA